MYTPDAKPTPETYDTAQQAFDQFNWTLFETQLPNCLITLQRKNRSFGYFLPEKHMRSANEYCDEIALNPVHFQTRTTLETLSTLVREMVNLWQFHYGTPGRKGYYNRQWAEKMKSIGLHPSSTGAPGGDETGYKVRHYIIEDGLFARAASELVDKGLKFEWGDRAAPPERNIAGDDRSQDGSGSSDDAAAQQAQGGVQTPKATGGTRVKYTCPVCGQTALSRKGAKFNCGFDNAPMLPPQAVKGRRG